MARKLKITPGEWKLDGGIVRNERGTIANCPLPKGGGTFDRRENAAFVAEAGTICNSRDLTVGELAAQLAEAQRLNGELAEALKAIKTYLENNMTPQIVLPYAVWKGACSALAINLSIFGRKP